MSRAEYARCADELYLSYFGRPTGGVRTVLDLRLPEPDQRLISKADLSPVRQGPSPQQARRDQIRRNGGKR